MTDPHHQTTPGDEDLLSKAVFAGSAEIHRIAERRPFMVAYFKGLLPRDAFVAWQQRLWHVYSALEEIDDVLSSDPVVGRMHSPELHRRATLEKDLEFLVGPDWRDSANLSAATDDYVERIRWCGKEFPPGFVAHQWLRYLGNVLAQDVNLRLIEKGLGLTDEGTSFFRFPQIEDPKAYLGAYHERMNSMPLDDEQKAGVIEEAKRAFELNIGLTDELAAEFGVADATEEEADALVEKLSAEHP